MGYQQGLSGLAAASNDLDVIGNNIANANTTGFKQSTAQFADVYANTVATAVGNQIGLGAALSTVQQDFSQGTITTTGQALNVAINGNGFYQMSNNGTITYSRNGVFQLDKNGYITDAAGNDLMGYAADSNGVINSAQTVALKVPTTNIAPLPTSNITAQLNLNAQATAPTTKTFDPTDSTSYNYSTSITAYDSLGGTQQVNLYFVQNATGSAQVYAVAAGQTTDLGTMSFDSSGALTATTDSTGTATAALGEFKLNVASTADPTKLDDGASPLSLTLNFTGTTQYGGASGVNNLAQDGYASGTLSNFTIGSDGTITGNYSNGQTMALGQIVLANFNNPNGLLNLGGNQFQQTAASGVAQVSTPGSTNHGTLTGGALEASNVDLTNQLVDLITAQRNYQANAQTIKTQQTVDQTLLQM
ncbi:flagellar hook protein FlgE [Paraburkholderia unamae]|uniref:Flagellar hook protein FlgE n=1 Tax=Paraburkholderia unamae TaxID=219649 RepID=A0ABX5KZX6_9BURK|nr:flagellar hook protein FlgE [Paraburkholderia unamae]PVX97385.1 flagellar hook protein FlgE [Paraburkholderia unamae]RAR66671.1 flagellar hook protein FlgE [Paraburkholderia unamae]CAG9253791.1 flagellar hook protein FlgE [Paraburkholderia unamae]